MMPEQAGQGRLVGSGRIGAGSYAEQSAAAFERSTPSAVGEESKVADANQAAGQDMQQEPIKWLPRPPKPIPRTFKHFRKAEKIYSI